MGIGISVSHPHCSWGGLQSAIVSFPEIRQVFDGSAEEVERTFQLFLMYRHASSSCYAFISRDSLYTGGVSTQLQSSGLVAHENSTFRNYALAVSGPFMA